MGIDNFPKQPQDVQDYDMDFSAYLDLMQDMALSHEVDPPPAGITLLHSEIVGQRIKVWLSGGVSRQRYKVTGRMHTVGGRTKEHEILILVKDT
jgi:hypothetical protein